MIKELIKLANSLDSKGLLKEADYLDSILRKLAGSVSDMTNGRYPGTPSDANPGSGFRAAVNHGQAAQDTQLRQSLTKELQKTYDWFTDVVFPAVEANNWPVVADADYTVWLGKALGGSGMKQVIKRGTSWASATANAINYGGEFGGGRKLELQYELLEDSVIKNKLGVTMQSWI